MILVRHRRLCHLTRLPWGFAPSQKASGWEKSMEENLESFFWLDQNYTLHFHSHSIGQNSVTRTAREAGKCRLAGFLGRRTKQVWGTNNCCHGEVEEETHTPETVFVSLFVSNLQKAKDLGSSKAILCWTFSFLKEFNLSFFIMIKAVLPLSEILPKNTSSQLWLSQDLRCCQK